MTTGNHPITKELVLLGGGHAHVAVLKSFAMRPLPGIQLTLVTKDIQTPYSGMLPGLIAGHYEFDEVHIDLRPLARLAGARVVNASADGLDLEENCLQLKDRPPLRFDVLSINTGSTPGAKSVPGAAKHALPVKPIDRFLLCWEKLKARIRKTRSKFHFCVVGGGAGGVELLLSMRHALRAEFPDQADLVQFKLITAGNTILPTHGTKVQQSYRKILEERGVMVIPGNRVLSVDEAELKCETGEPHAYDALVWVTNASAPAWIAESGLATDESGFVAVNPFLQSTSHPNVFAAGDVASMLETPRPKSGVFAVRQGPPLTFNLRASLAGFPMEPFHPQKRFLSLISTGDKRAVASWGPFAADGGLIWRWKDSIDRRWMRQYQDIGLVKQQRGGMQAPAVESYDEDRMRCGGCGAKVGAKVLRRALERLEIDASDDAAIIEIPNDTKLIQSVDFFREFIADPYLFGQIAAHHSLNDLFAMGAQPHSAVATVVVPYGNESVVEEAVFQMLSGALSVLQAHNAKLVGGHTAEGAEPAFGLTVNGHHSTAPLAKLGVREGDHLVLTKPLGTGIIFAADMRSQAKGRWVEGAVNSMLHSNARAAGILTQAGASAGTDVTGFGLLGHLSEMLSDTLLQARLSLNDIPLLDGVTELLDQGIASSMLPANRLSAPEHLIDHGSKDLSKILFDPQTAGGLLAGVPTEQIDDCLRQLRDNGYAHARDIGAISSREADSGLLVRVA